MQWLRVGHFTHQKNGTGLTAFLFTKPVVGAYWLCGSAPATHEINTLDLESRVTHVNGLVFSGGSAFGLPALNGVLRWMQEQKIGWETPYGLVPILPAAAIYDLGVETTFPPTEADAYQACLDATENNFMHGRIGAGTGASVGKIVPDSKPMSGGIGCAVISTVEGVNVLAYAVVNCVGDVRDQKGHIIAGARLANGNFANCEDYLLSGQLEKLAAPSNTTLVAIFTNANFSKIELKRIAKMAVAGMARTISPVFSQYDGDIVFCFSSGEKTASEMMIGTMAVEAIQKAIINAVQESIIL